MRPNGLTASHLGPCPGYLPKGFDHWDLKDNGNGQRLCRRRSLASSGGFNQKGH
ncbi:MAG: hypothetical protein LBP22_05720 [Deltaproteobacteria bacterium]|nr:hypothetical protein [Deltaproteobacteria bacterium]